MPKVNQHVKCILRTGAIAEGFVEEWSNVKVQLKSLDGESILIIPHPNEDIMMIKIIIGNICQKDTHSNSTAAYNETTNELEKEIQYTKDLPSDDPKRIKTLAKLRVMLVKQEKKIIAEKVKSHNIGDVRKVKYGQPEFFKKPST